MATELTKVVFPTTDYIDLNKYRLLTNNDFDTINVTELNAGDLIVTGVGRFTNGLYGNLIGNADTASSAIKATQDESGNNIKSTYASAISISDHTITLKNKNGTSLGTVTVPDNNTTYTVDTGTANGKIKVTPSSGNAYEVSVYGLKSAAYKDVVDTYSATGTDPVSGKAVAAAIDALPEPMVFKGTVGDGGTVTWGNLPAPATTNEGHTYKVTTAKTKEQISTLTQDVKLGDTIISNKVNWVVIPSGDEPSGTVTNVAISNGGGLSVSGSPITSSGTITISHADTSSQASVNNSGRTYIQDITLDTYGHVTGITSATETVVNTDRYVNSAAFADATSADANNPVKMTLTRAGSDTASVTAYIPKVSSSSAGVAPKGAAVSSQSQTTKFLREDGTWQAPSYTPVIDNLTSSTSTTSALSAKQGYLLANGSARDNTKLPLAGGTMTGGINLPGNQSVAWNDKGIVFTNGSRIGESSVLGIYGCGSIYLRPNAGSGSNGEGIQITTDGLIPDNNNTETLGDSSHKWKYVYAQYLNQSSNTEVPTTSSYWMFCNSDGYLRKSTRENFEKVIYPYEAMLRWGGRNITAGYAPIDAALADPLRANRLAGVPAAAVTVEYTRDGGTTWTDYGLSDTSKRGLFTTSSSVTIGKADSTNKATEHGTDYQLRITLDSIDGNIYTTLQKFIILVSTNGSQYCKVRLEGAKGSDVTTFNTIVDDTDISGWSGYNVINTSFTTYGNSASASSQYRKIRFIFWANGGSSSYPGLVISSIYGYGGVGWSCPSQLARTGHVYSYDGNLNVAFPNRVDIGTRETTTAPSSATSVNRITIIPYYHTGGPWYIASKDDASNSYITFRYGNNEVASIKHNGLITANGFSGPLTGNVIGNCSGSSGSCTGNSATATTAANLNGFTNTTSTGTAIDSATQNGHVYVTSTSGIYGIADGAAFVQAYSTNWVAQIYQDYRTGQIALRGKNNGTWQAWRKVWDSVNLTSKTAAASGTDLSLVTTGEKATWNAKASTDTKNTAGSTDTSSKIFLIGATSQAANPQTYSDNEVYATSGVLTTKSVQVGGGSATIQYNSTTQSLDFVFAS